MKDKFSKFINLQGKYLTSLLFVLLLGIGQMWATEETLTWAFSGINAACTDPSGITKSSTNATSTIQSSMAASFSNVKTKSDASQTGYSSKLQSTDGTYLGVKADKTIDANQYVGASFAIPEGYVFKLKSISFPYCAISTGINARLTISDGETNVTPSDGSASSGGSTTISYSDPTMAKELSGNVTVKIWFWMPGSTSTGKYAGLGDLAITGDLVESTTTPIAVTGITLEPSSATIKVGKTVTLGAIITPSNATDKAVTWSVTSGDSFASVDAYGVVTGLAAGTATITATAHDGSGTNQTATITVEECPTSGTIFSMNITASEGTAYTGNNTFPTLIDATYVGGAAYSGSKSETNRTSTINANGEYPFSAHSELAIKVVMDCDLAEGDIINITTSSTRQIKIQKVVGTDLHKTADKTFTIPSGSSLIGENVFYLMRDNSESTLKSFTVIRPLYRTITLEYADGATADGSIEVIDGTAATKPADPTWAHHRFDGWYNGASPYDWTATVSGDLTLTAHWTQLYGVTYAKGAEDATGTAPTQDELAAGEKFTVAANAFTYAGYDFSTWSDGSNNFDPGMEYTMGSANVTLTAQWVTASTKYAITKGSHANGDFTIDPAEQAEGQKVTLAATPAEDYLFGAWQIVKTEDASATGILVDDNGQFEMPAYAVTVNATFAADPRTKVLYVTSNTADATKANDKLYDALKDIYNVKIVGPTSTETVTSYALVVLHESVNGSNYNAAAVAAAKTSAVPVLNTKSYFYTSARWNWATPNAGKKTKGVHVNTGYCNITSHPLFNELTPDENDSIIILSSIHGDNKPIQPVTSFTSGKEGYTLANVPDGCAIHELTPAQRGVASGKYLLISVYNHDLNNLNANGQKLFQNAAAYLIDGSANWTPVVVPTAAAIVADPSENYTESNTITLTASAVGTIASTTYTWYKGADWATASATTPVQAASTSAIFTKTAELADAGTYWCNISNGTGCDAQASVTITVSSASTPTHTITYDNLKGVDVSAYPTEYTEGVGVASFAPLADITGWHFVEWSPASIGTDADENVTITAIWAEIFEVSFNGNGHGDPIAAQNVVDGDKANRPADPSEIGYDFGGWYKEAGCTNAWDFANDIVTEDTELFAKWTAFDGCVLLVPATSGEAPAVDDAISMQTGSKGATMTVLDLGQGNIAYNANGLAFNSKSGPKVGIVMSNDMQVGTTISMTLVAGGDKTRGLTLHKANGDKINAFTCWVEGTNPATNGAVETFTYTVVADDGLEGTNEFQLARNNTVYLKSLKVSNCGSAITFHNLTSAVDPAGKGVVTLGASSVREGYTTTATYSAIDEAYEFDEWQISGEDASIADASANPAVITMGTADAVVTLKLKAATPKHTVSYNVMGHGVAPANEQVKEGAKVTKPADPVVDNWAFCGWYKESTLENAWDFAVDVMGTSDIELFAKWEDETGAIKLFDGEGNLNTTNFVSPAKTTVEINEVTYPCVAQFGSNKSTFSSVTPADMIQYNATTDAAKIQIKLYNSSSSAKKAYLYKWAEGEDVEKVEIALPASQITTTEYYTFNSSKNRSFYICSDDRSNTRILQVKVLDNGTAIKQAGQVGYSLNFNKGRMYVSTSAATSFEGATINASSEYKVNSNSNLATYSYISFTTTVDKTILKVTRSGGNYYVSQDPENKGTSYNTNQEIELSPAGTWYLGSNNPGSAASFTKIEFLAPKCAEPAFNALANSEICEGDPYVALDGSATVADAAITGSISYQWYKGDNTLIEGEENATFTPSEDGSYYVIAINHREGYSDNEKKSATVTVAHFASAVITTTPKNVRDDAGNEFTLSVAATGKNLSYEWFTCNEDGTGAVAVDPACTATSFTANVPAVTTYYKVVVSSDCGSAEALAKVEPWVDFVQVNVSDNTSWDFTTCADAEIKLTDATTPKKGQECLMANIRGVHYDDPAFNAQALIFAGEYIYRNVTGKPLGAITLKFTTTVDGFVTIRFADNGSNNRCLRVTDSEGVEYSQSSASNSDIQEFTTFVHAGDVEIMGMSQDKASDRQYVRIFNLAFEKVDYSREVNAGRYGTICLPTAGVIVGASIFEMAYYDASQNKIFMDEVQSGEMVADRPYVFLPNEDVTHIGVYYTETEKTEVEAGNYRGLFGTYADLSSANTTESPLWNNYIISANQYIRVTGSNCTLKKNRAYIKLDGEGKVPTNAPALAPGRRRVGMAVQNTEVATDIDNLNACETPVKMIIDGKMYILRGEKMYDATGRLVK